jgi:hypothetical protein
LADFYNDFNGSIRILIWADFVGLRMFMERTVNVEGFSDGGGGIIVPYVF